MISWRGPENSRKRAAEREVAEKKERRRRKRQGRAARAGDHEADSTTEPSKMGEAEQ